MKAWPYLTAAALVALIVIANRRADLAAFAPDDVVPLDDTAPDTGGDGEQGQGSVVADALATIDPSTYWPTMTDTSTEDANVAAGLAMIRFAEGTKGANGYRTMFGYRYFNDFADHPREPAQFTDKQGRRLWTSAAGAYQFMAVSPIPGGGSTKVDTWDRLQRKLALPDFSPASQDAAAIELINEAGALNDLKAGRFGAFVTKCSRTWASLPGAGYAQPERKLADLQTAYINAGGTLA
jgi:muramidase (phage lysozyme)